jgi:flavin reductase (DIM6/NTAB) family NADH-FMN oxidoreductase RutF
MGEPFDARAFRTALGAYPTGVTIVTAADGPSHVAMAANSFASVSIDPPLLLWCVGRQSKRHDAFASAGAFVINILSDSLADVCREVSGSGSTTVQDHLLRPTILGPPAIQGAIAVFECCAHDLHAHGDHSILIGRVVRFTSTTPGSPLLFHGGQLKSFEAQPLPVV